MDNGQIYPAYQGRWASVVDPLTFDRGMFKLLHPFRVDIVKVIETVELMADEYIRAPTCIYDLSFQLKHRRAHKLKPRIDIT